MSGGQPSEEIAEDYMSSLESLTTNDRYAINNFTVIAKENTEHADAISNALVEHIRKAPPSYKLPALYVLDSIAKNIGTPYTLFLGHKLYGTFMGAYSLVDHPTRRKLEEMLKTWKTSVPGSVDSRPVFPNEITKKIENALIQAKTAALKQQQQLNTHQQNPLRTRTPVMSAPTQWRNTPTPPMNGSHYLPPIPQNYVQQGMPNGHAPVFSPHPPYPQFQQSAPIVPQYQQPQPYQNSYPFQPPAGPDVGLLRRDVEHLISVGKEDVANNLDDASRRTRLMALLQLQTVLNSQQLSTEELLAVRRQVDDLQRQLNDRQTAARFSAIPPAPLPLVTGPPITGPQTYTTHAPPTSSSYPQPSSTAALPPASNLAALLAAAGRAQVATPKPLSVPRPPVTRSSAVSISPAASNPSDLMSQLRAAGLIPPTTAPPVDRAPAASQAPLTLIPPSISTSLARLIQAPSTSPAEGNSYVELTSTSLKIHRPHLISKLYEAKPNQCLTCGRRFLANEEGRAQKARHLDWHFRTNQRLADSAKRGQSRSWYVDELEWIKSREQEEGSDAVANGVKDAKSLAAEAAAKNDPKTKFIPAPSDSVLSNQPCSICQEKFNASWNKELQDWVWMDAIKLGNRVYHASCYADMKKDGGDTPNRTSTPDSVLGKRKAEAVSNPSSAKAQRQSIE